MAIAPPKKPEKTNLITPDGYDRMYAELRKLADDERPKLNTFMGASDCARWISGLIFSRADLRRPGL